MFEVVGQSQEGTYNENLLFDDFESFFQTSGTPCTQYENENYDISWNLNETTNSQDLTFNLLLEQDIGDLDINLLQDIVDNDTDEQNKSLDVIELENNIFNVINADSHENRKSSSEHVTNLTGLKFTNEENHLHQHQEYNILQHGNDLMLVQEKENIDDGPINQDEDHKKYQISLIKHGHNNQSSSLIQYSEDLNILNPSDCSPNHDIEPTHQEEVSSPILDYNYSSSDLTEDEAKTLVECVKIIKSKKKPFTGEDLLLQAQALLSEPQSLFVPSDPSSPQTKSRKDKNQVPASRKRKRKLNDDEIFLEELVDKNKKLRVQEERLSKAVWSLKSKYIEYIKNKKVVICSNPSKL